MRIDSSTYAGDFVQVRAVGMEKYLRLLGKADHPVNLIRLSIAIVFYLDWIIKIRSTCEADSITPFVANSPLMSFL